MGVRAQAERQGAVLLVLVAVTLAGPAHGHTQLIASEPADGTRLESTSGTVKLRFSGAIQPGFSDFAWHFLGAERDGTVGADNRLTRPEPALDASRRTVELPVPEGLQSGWYALDWQVLAEDGHDSAGTQRFRIDPPAR